MPIDLYNGECLEVMDKLIEQGVQVDAVITDTPYGTTACKWDTIIPLEPMWERLNKLCKLNGVKVLFGSEPFTSILIVSKIDEYREKIIWEKHKPSNFPQAKKRLMKYCEDIIIFNSCIKNTTFNQQYTDRISERIKNANKDYVFEKKKTSIVSASSSIKGVSSSKYNPDKKLQGDIFKGVYMVNNAKEKVDHPTQKPISLMEQLIKIYTNEGETVLDFTMGSGTTGVACKNLNRNFIGIELDEKYYNIAKQRILGINNEN